MRDQLESLIGQMIDRGIRFEEATREFEKRFIRRVLEAHEGNQSKSAKILGIHRNTLSRKMIELDLNHRPKRRRSAGR